MLIKDSDWIKCVEFHGHECPGLAIGYKAAQLARELLKAQFSADEEIVCVSENDACGVDAIQVLLGCSAGKGILMIRLRGKQAFNFIGRESGNAIRLILKPLPTNPSASKSERALYILNAKADTLFEVKKPSFELPGRARIFTSLPCSICGEITAEPFLQTVDGKLVCTDCAAR